MAQHDWIQQHHNSHGIFDAQPDLWDSDEEHVGLLSITSRAFTSYTRTLNTRTKRYMIPNNITNLQSNHIILIRNGKDSFAAPLSSGPLLLILLLLRVQ